MENCQILEWLILNANWLGRMSIFGTKNAVWIEALKSESEDLWTTAEILTELFYATLISILLSEFYRYSITPLYMVMSAIVPFPLTYVLLFHWRSSKHLPSPKYIRSTRSMQLLDDLVTNGSWLNVTTKTDSKIRIKKSHRGCEVLVFWRINFDLVEIIWDFSAR